MKVLHLPENIGAHASSLVHAERGIGLQSELLTLYETRFSFPSDICLRLDNKPKLTRLAGHIGAFARYRRGYDVYHFNYGSSLLHFPSYGLNLLDVPFYDRRAKKIFTYQGCDARQKYPTMERNRLQGSESAACFKEGCYGGVCNSGQRDTQRRKAIEKAEKYADHMFALNPDLLYFLPAEKASFMPYAIAGLDKIKPRTGPFFGNDKIHIVHAPTQRETKGTPYILSALHALCEKFPGRIDVTLVENMPHAEALKAYRHADLVIDQLLIGWYGGLAVEVMKMGIPVATFINDDHLQFVPPEMAQQLPFLRINKFNIFKRLTEFVTERDMVNDLAKQARDFVDRWHDPEALARLSAAAYSGEPMPDL
jgi:hypothetical protein